MMKRVRMIGVSRAVGTQPIVKSVRTSRPTAGALSRLALVARQLFHLAFQLRIDVPSAIFALDVNSHLLEANLDALLERLHRLVDTRSMDH